MILERRGAAALRRRAQDEGMIPLRRNALRAFAGGRTTLEEVDRVTYGDAG